MFCKLCGDAALKNVVLVTNMWGEVSHSIGEAREQELSSKFFKPVLDKGAQMARHHNTVQSSHDIIRRAMKNHPIVLQIQRELVDEGKDIANTAAGEAVDQELKEQIRRHQAELEAVQDEMVQALKEKDEETRQELEGERIKLQEQMEMIAKVSGGMALNYAAEKERVEARMKEVEQEAEERERAEVEYYLQPADPSRRPQDAVNVSVVDQPRLEQDIERPQDRLDGPDDNGWVAIPIYK